MKGTKRLIYCAILISLALVLSYMERFIPLQMVVALPGIKLGLANVVTLLALYFLGTGSAFTILILRCFLGSFFGGGLSALAFSLFGGVLALLMMTLARRIPIFSVYGVSVWGAAAHNLGQIMVAVVLMQSVYVAGYLPYLLVVSVFTGLATGSICSGVFRILSVTGQIPEGEITAYRG